MATKFNLMDYASVLDNEHLSGGDDQDADVDDNNSANATDQSKLKTIIQEHVNYFQNALQRLCHHDLLIEEMVRYQSIYTPEEIKFFKDVVKKEKNSLDKYAENNNFDEQLLNICMHKVRINITEKHVYRWLQINEDFFIDGEHDSKMTGIIDSLNRGNEEFEKMFI